MSVGKLRPGDLVRFVIPCRRHQRHLRTGSVVEDLTVCVVLDVPDLTPTRRVVWRSNIHKIIEVLS